MIKIENHIGAITFSESYLKQLVEHIVIGCFGIAGISNANSITRVIPVVKNNAKKGIVIRNYEDKIIVDLHIIVAFGTNIGAIVDSVSHKLEFAILESLGNVDCKINVFVDNMND